MLRIQRALLVEILFVLVLVTLVITGAVFLGVSLRFVQEGGGALGSRLLLQLLPSLLPISLSYAVPFAFLAAVALVLGRWVSDHECTAIKTAGVHMRTIVVPLVAVGCLLAAAGMYYNGFHVPRANRHLRTNLREFLPQFLSSLRGADRSVIFSSGRLSFDRWDEADDAFVSVELDRRDNHGRLAEKAIMKRLRLARIRQSDEQEGLRLELEKAYLIQVPGGNLEVAWGGESPLVMGRVERVGASTLFNQFFGAFRFYFRPRDLTVPELIYAIERGGIARGSVSEVKIALHGRLALGSASLFLGLFAIAVMLVVPPAGRRVRDFMLCFLPAVLLFFPLQIAGPSIARSTSVPPWLAMWLPNLVILSVSCLLLARAFRR